MQKLIDLNTIAANEQGPLHLERRREGRRSSMRLRRAPALHFDCG
jgi:hypothetical protein